MVLDWVWHTYHGSTTNISQLLALAASRTYCYNSTQPLRCITVPWDLFSSKCLILQFQLGSQAAFFSACSPAPSSYQWPWWGSSLCPPARPRGRCPPAGRSRRRRTGAGGRESPALPALCRLLVLLTCDRFRQRIQRRIQEKQSASNLDVNVLGKRNLTLFAIVTK